MIKQSMISFMTGILVVVLFPLALVNAQEKLTLSVDDAVQLGFKNNKSLHLSLMKVRNSEAKAGETNASMLPSLKFNGSYTRLSDIPPALFTLPPAFTQMLPPSVKIPPMEFSPSISNNYSLKFSLSQPLFTGSRLSNSSKLASYSSMATNEDYNKDKEELVYNIKNGYWSLYKAVQLKNVIDENVNQIKAHLTDANNLLKQGLITDNDVLKLKVQLSNVMYSQVDLDNGVKLAKIALNNVIGIPLSTEIAIQVDTNITEIQIADMDALVDIALGNRPDVKAANYRIKASESGVKIAQAGWFPQIYLYGDYLYNRPNSRVFPAKDAFKDTWDAGITLSFDIWNWGTTIHQTHQAESQLEQARDALGIIKDAITLEVTQNYLNVEQAKEKINIAKISVSQAEENMRVTESKFKNGLALSSDMVDAEVALLQAKTNYTNSLVDYELAKARLEKSVGNQSL